VLSFIKGDIMNFKEGVSRALAIIKLDGAAVDDTAHDSSATGMAFVIAILAGVAGVIGALLQQLISGTAKGLLASLASLVGGAILSAVMMVILLLVSTLVYWVLGLIFGGRAPFMELLRPLGYSAIIGWVMLIPFVGPFLAFFAAIWSIVVDVIIVREVFDFSTGKAAAVVLIPVITAGIIAVAIAAWIISAIGPASMAQLTALQ